MEILVDPQDKHFLEDFKWRISPQGYAVCKSSKLMHRLIMNPPKGTCVDHINGNKLDNRRSNLRLCNQSENSANVGLKKNNTTGYKGVFFAPRANKSKPWMAQIMKNRKSIYIGYYATKKEAAQAYNATAENLFGEFANI